MGVPPARIDLDNQLSIAALKFVCDSLPPALWVSHYRYADTELNILLHRNWHVYAYRDFNMSKII